MERYENIPQVTSNPQLFQSQAVTNAPSLVNPIGLDGMLPMRTGPNFSLMDSVSSITPGLGSMLGSGLGAIAGIANGFFERNWQANQAELNRNFQSEEAQKSRDWNEEMWNKSNEYNTPAAQLQRLLDAGINPSTAVGMMGGSSTAAGSSHGPADSEVAPSGSQAQLPGSMSGSLMDLIGGTSKTIYGNMLMNEDVLNKKGQNTILQATIPQLVQLSHLTNKEAEKRIAQMVVTTQSEQEKVRLTRLQSYAQQLSNDNYQRMVDIDIALKRSNYKLNNANIKVQDAQAALVAAKQGLIPYEAAVLISQRALNYDTGYMNRQMGEHAGDKSLEQVLGGILNDVYEDPAIGEDVQNFVKTILGHPAENKEFEKYHKQLIKLTDRYMSGEIGAERYKSEVRLVLSNITVDNDLNSNVRPGQFNNLGSDFLYDNARSRASTGGSR